MNCNMKNINHIFLKKLLCILIYYLAILLYSSNK